MLNLSYITDVSGNQIGVQIPMNDWVIFQNEYKELQRKFEILQGIRDALSEVREVKKGKRKLQTLTEFLNES